GVAAAFEAAAQEALPREPALSAQLYAAGVAAGRPVGAVATRWARAAALAGDLDVALRMADRVLTCEEAPDRADSARVAAAALAPPVAWHRGEAALAESVLGRAIAAGMGGALMSTRHRLLHAWSLMARGETDAARDQLAGIETSTDALEPRDWLFAVALELG